MVGTNIALIIAAPLLVFAMSLGLQTFKKPQLNFIANASDGGHCRVITGSVLSQNDFQVEILTNYKSKRSIRFRRPVPESSQSRFFNITKTARAFVGRIGSKIGEFDQPKNTAILTRAAFSHAVEAKSGVPNQLRDCTDNTPAPQKVDLSAPIFLANHNVFTTPEPTDKGEPPLHDHQDLANKEHEHKTSRKEKQHVNNVVVPLNLAIQQPEPQDQDNINFVSNIFYVNGKKSKRFDGKKFILLPFFPALPKGSGKKDDYITTAKGAFNFAIEKFEDPQYAKLTYINQPATKKPITFLATVSDVLKSCLKKIPQNEKLSIDVQGFASYQQFKKAKGETEEERENRNHALAEGRRLAVISRLSELMPPSSFEKLDFTTGQHNLTFKQLLRDETSRISEVLGIQPRFKNQKAMFDKLAEWLEKPNPNSLDPLRSLFARSVAIEWETMGKCDNVPEYKSAL